MKAFLGIAVVMFFAYIALTETLGWLLTDRAITLIVLATIPIGVVWALIDKIKAVAEARALRRYARSEEWPSAPGS